MADVVPLKTKAGKNSGMFISHASQIFERAVVRYESDIDKYSGFRWTLWIFQLETVQVEDLRDLVSSEIIRDSPFLKLSSTSLPKDLFSETSHVLQSTSWFKINSTKSRSTVQGYSRDPEIGEHRDWKNSESEGNAARKMTGHKWDPHTCFPRRDLNLKIFSNVNSVTKEIYTRVLALLPIAISSLKGTPSLKEEPGTVKVEASHFKTRSSGSSYMIFFHELLSAREWKLDYPLAAVATLLFFQINKLIPISQQASADCEIKSRIDSADLSPVCNFVDPSECVCLFLQFNFPFKPLDFIYLKKKLNCDVNLHYPRQYTRESSRSFFQAPISHWIRSRGEGTRRFFSRLSVNTPTGGGMGIILSTKRGNRGNTRAFILQEGSLRCEERVVPPRGTSFE
ncbi:hypothetical protein WN51_09843 [Melipona quadrifasciata]|uniref:Uncharacterized protein n=1 Tax=Melipona quadrifasciata TaxID=166423 RepID=A0A0M9A7M0_9HYME|nr:hypothetical protein WN51_09843 [Melipona quadrifasciata]